MSSRPRPISMASSSRPPSIVSNASFSSTSSSNFSYAGIQAAIDAKDGRAPYPDIKPPQAEDEDSAEIIGVRPRHALMRARRTSMPAVVATTAHNTIRPKLGEKRMSTASNFSLTSFESLPEEDVSVLKVSEIRTEPAQLVESPKDGLHQFPRPPVLRRSPPSGNVRPTSIASIVSEPGTNTLNVPDPRRLSLPSAQKTINHKSKSLSRSPSPLNTQRTNLPHSSMRRTVTEPLSPKSDRHLSEKDSDAQQKRRQQRTNIIQEIVDTEKAYNNILSSVQTHYLDPLLAQIANATPEKPPLLDRRGVSEIFSNFTDIAVLAREMLRRLEQGVTPQPAPEVVERSIEFPFFSSPRKKQQQQRVSLLPDPAAPSTAAAVSSGLAGSLMLPLCPFLKCYSLFIQNFSRSLARIRMEEEHSEEWRRFTSSVKASGVGQGLDLGAMLLNIIQRIPRYKLLLADLMRKTDYDHPDSTDLSQACRVIEQVATFLDTSIKLHDSTLQIFEIQKAMIGLETPLVVPGRRLLRSGKLRKVGRREEQYRHFFLFNDALLYASDVNASPGWSRAVSMTGLSAIAEQRPSSPSVYKSRHNLVQQTPQSMPNQQYQFHHLLQLKDMTVISSDGAYFEIRSPDKSFAVAAPDVSEKIDWIEAIRTARDDWLTTRRTLQTGSQEELSSGGEHPTDVPELSTTPSVTPLATPSLATPGLPSVSTTDGAVRARSPGKKRLSFQDVLPPPLTPTAENGPIIRLPDSYSAPIWIPDHKASRCMQCQETFRLWRRKHHCRLCGNIVCWVCSTNTFIIPSSLSSSTSSGNGTEAKGRACDACYFSFFEQEQKTQTAVLDLARFVQT